MFYRYIIFLIFLTNITACSTKDFDNASSASEQMSEESTLVVDNNSLSTSFVVSRSMLNRYLRLSKKTNRVSQITPIIRNGDTLLYYVEYSNNSGWDIVSADTRVSPLLAFSSEGSLFSEDNEIDISPISGLLETITVIKQSNQKPIGLWQSLSDSKNISHSSMGTRGVGQGMWIPQDTTLRYTSTQTPRLIGTEWHQRDPWDHYTPMPNSSHCKVGCTSVAVGQILYKYLSSNPRPKDTIPTTGVVYTDHTDFSDFSTSAWTYLAKRHSLDSLNNCYKTAVFLSWVGHNIGEHYGIDYTYTNDETEKTFLERYLTPRRWNGGNPSTSYTKNQFCDTLISSLTSGSPVYMVSKYNNTDSLHCFIIDYYLKNEVEFVVRYVFDPYHTVTEDEMLHNPQWCFEWPTDCDPEKEIAECEVLVPYMRDEYVKMNWGWKRNNNGSTPNNTSYLIRSRSYSTEDPTLFTEDYFLTWSARGYTFYSIQYGYHHFYKPLN